MRKPDGQTVFLGSAVFGALAIVLYLTLFYQSGNGQSRRERQTTVSNLTLEDIPFDGARAYQWIKDLCALGPRYSGSEGMAKQQEMLIAHFRDLGGQVELQQFRVRHPVDGSAVPMANLIVRWHPQRKERILLCAHYDTRPYPDQDPDPAARRGVFVGANDGASGVAVLAELGRHMPQFKSPVGVDFVLFDGEELVYRERDPYFLGSEHFARDYASGSHDYKYRVAVLLDMVGDAHLDLYQERNGLRWRDTRPFVQEIWDTAAQLGVREFVDRPMRTEIRDDHIMLHDVGGIPACDIIDFEYRRPGSRQSVLAHAHGHAGPMFGVIAGQGRVGSARMAPASAMNRLM